MRALTVGQQVTAKQDRIFEYAGHDPMVIWKKDQVLTIAGIVQHEPGQLEFLIDLENGDWENVPAPIMEEIFNLPPAL